ncbi:hypothetical protein Bca101_059337 [Brassica carinata]
MKRLEERERKIALSMSECKETEGDLSKRLQKLTAKENGWWLAWVCICSV